VHGLRELRVSVGATLLLVRYREGDIAVLDLTASTARELRLDQVTQIYRLARDAEKGDFDIAEGLERLRSTLAMKARYGALVAIGGMALIAAGVSLVLAPSLLTLIICLLFGSLVGLIRIAAQRWPAVWPLVPVVSGSVVAALGLTFINEGAEVTAAGILIPPLAVFLPGTALTVAMIELSAGDIVSGGSRLAFGAVRLLLLVFGIVIVAQSLHWQGSGTIVPEHTLAPVFRVTGVLLFTTGICLHYSTPKGSWLWLQIVVITAWGTQQLSSLVLGTYLSAALAGGVMVTIAGVLEQRWHAPPLIVSYTPAFWLLVPGSLGLKGFSELAQDNPQAALTDLFIMILIMAAIALGMLAGLLITGNRHMHELT
jgi:uncharacterized membrane protein YjjP (DUF1212 family)